MSIKIAILGLGNAGEKHLIECLKKKEIKLVGCLTKSDLTAKKMSKKYNIFCTTKLNDLLHFKPNGVIIATPTNTHNYYSNILLKENINILVEKPISFNDKEIEDLKKSHIKYKKILVPCHNFVNSKGFNYLKNYIFTNNLLNKIDKINIIRYETTSDENINYNKEYIFNSYYHLVYLFINLLKTKYNYEINYSNIVNDKNKFALNSEIIYDSKLINLNYNLRYNTDYKIKNKIKLEIIFKDKLIEWVLIDNKEFIKIRQENKVFLIFTNHDINLIKEMTLNFINAINNSSYDHFNIDEPILTTKICNKIINSLKESNRKAGYLQITRKCNNNCIFCSNPKFEKEISISEISDIIKEYKALNINEILLTGGEPTTHSQLFKIINLLKNNKINVKIITNGINLEDEDFVKKIDNCNINSIHFSFHSHIEELSEELYGSKNIISKQKKALNNILKSKINVSINTTINSINYKYLYDQMVYIYKNYPNVKHIVFNFLDPGISDGIIINNANKNNWIIPKYKDIEYPLFKALNFLKSKKITFRVERVPLCYMKSFEEFSTETRKIVKKNEYICAFTREKRTSEIRKVNSHYKIKIKNKCDVCTLNDICSGIQKEYIIIHGDKEIHPSFDNPKKIIKKIFKN